MKYLSVRTLAIIGVTLPVCALGFFAYRTYTYVPAGESFKDNYSLVLEDFEGKKVELADYKREILVMHVWAS